MTAEPSGRGAEGDGCGPHWGNPGRCPHWQLETDPARFSEWEVRFVAETSPRTRVEIEHRNLDRHGEGWEGVGEGIGGDQGWPLYLNRYAGLFTEAK